MYKSLDVQKGSNIKLYVNNGIHRRKDEGEADADDQEGKNRVEGLFPDDLAQKEMRENAEKTAEGVVNDVDVGEHADTTDDLKNLEADGDQKAQ